MGKTVKLIVAAVVVIALVVVAQPALAGLIAGKAAVAAGTIGIGAKLIAAIAIAAASTLAQRLIMGKPKGIGNSVFERMNITVEPTAPRRIVFGLTAAAADERFHEKIKRDQGGQNPTHLRPYKKGDYFYRVIALASHRINAVKQIYFEDTLSYNGSSAIGKFTKDEGLKVHPVLEGKRNNGFRFGSGGYWTNNSTFTGCAYLCLVHRMDADIYPDGIPTRLTTVVEGCPVYDPRLDSTNGGSGSHRPTDNATWQWSNGARQIGRNPALALLTYLLGWRVNGKLMWGMGIPASRIDFANFIEYANICEESVTSHYGGTTQRYTCDGIFSTAEAHESILAAITSCMGAAKLVDTGGLYQLVGGVNDLDGPIATFTERDLLGQYEWRPSQAVREYFNIVRGRFTNPSKLYQLEDWGEIETAPLADGIPRTLVLELPAVTRAETAQRIAKQFLIRNHYSGILTATFMPAAFTVQVGSLIRLVLPSEGWAQPGKLFRVIAQEETAEMLFQMTLQEENEAIYAFDLDEVKPLPDDIRPPGYNPEAQEPVEGLTVSSQAVDGANGVRQSQITVQWDEPDAAVGSIAIEVSTDGTVWNEVAARFSASAEEFVFNAPVSGVATQVRARFRMLSGIYGPYSTTTVQAAVGSGVPSFVGYLTDPAVTFAADSNGNIL